MHAEHFFGLLEANGALLYGTDHADGGRAQLRALERLRLELDNLLEALDTAVNRRHAGWLRASARRLVRVLDLTGGSSKTLALLGPLLPLADEIGDDELLLHLKLGICRSIWQLGQIDEAREMLHSALELARARADLSAEARALNALGVLDHLQGNFVESFALHTQARELSRLCGDRWNECSCLTNLGIVKFLQGDFPTSRLIATEALAMRIELGDIYGQSNALHNLAIVDLAQREYAAAEDRIEQSIHIQRTLADKRGLALSFSNLAFVKHRLGDSGNAWELQQLALELHEGLGDEHSGAYALTHLALLADSFGRYAESARLCERALSIRVAQGDTLGITTSVGMAGLALCRLDQPVSAALALYAIKPSLDGGLGGDDGLLTEHISSGFAVLEQQIGLESDTLIESRQLAANLTTEKVARLTLRELQLAIAQSGD